MRRIEKAGIGIVSFLFGCAAGLVLSMLIETMQRPECSGSDVPIHCVD